MELESLVLRMAIRGVVAGGSVSGGRSASESLPSCAACAVRSGPNLLNVASNCWETMCPIESRQSSKLLHSFRLNAV